MFSWLRYRFMLWRVNRNRRKANKDAFEAYVTELESLTGQTIAPWQRDVLRSMYGDYKRRTD